MYTENHIHKIDLTVREVLEEGMNPDIDFITYKRVDGTTIELYDQMLFVSVGKTWEIIETGSPLNDFIQICGDCHGASVLLINNKLYIFEV